MEPVILKTRFVEQVLGGADPAAFDHLVDPRVRVITGLKPTGHIEGAEEYRAVFAGFAAAFRAEAPLEVLDAFGTAERAVVRFQARLRHVAPYFGVPASGRVVLFDETHVSRWQGGRMMENIVSATNLEFEMLMAPVLAPLILGGEGNV